MESASHETAMGAKLAARGVVPREVRAQIAIAEWMNNGGSEARLIELVRAAYEKGSEGRRQGAAKGHMSVANASRANESEGHSADAEKAFSRLPELSPRSLAVKAVEPQDLARGERNWAGQKMHAAKAVVALPRPVSPAYIAAAKTGAKHLALTVLDSFKVRDGRPIGDVPWSSLDRLIAEGGHEVAVLKILRNRGVPTDKNAPMRLLVGVAEMERTIQKAAEMADAA